MGMALFKLPAFDSQMGKRWRQFRRGGASSVALTFRRLPVVGEREQLPMCQASSGIGRGYCPIDSRRVARMKSAVGELPLIALAAGRAAGCFGEGDSLDATIAGQVRGMPD